MGWNGVEWGGMGWKGVGSSCYDATSLTLGTEWLVAPPTYSPHSVQRMLAVPTPRRIRTRHPLHMCRCTPRTRRGGYRQLRAVGGEGVREVSKLRVGDCGRQRESVGGSGRA